MSTTHKQDKVDTEKKGIERWLLSRWDLKPWIDGIGSVTFWGLNQITVDMTPSRFKWTSDDSEFVKRSFKSHGLEMTSYEIGYEYRRIQIHFFFKEEK